MIATRMRAMLKRFLAGSKDSSGKGDVYMTSNDLDNGELLIFSSRAIVYL